MAPASGIKLSYVKGKPLTNNVHQAAGAARETSALPLLKHSLLSSKMNFSVRLNQLQQGSSHHRSLSRRASPPMASWLHTSAWRLSAITSSSAARPRASGASTAARFGRSPLCVTLYTKYGHFCDQNL